MDCDVSLSDNLNIQKHVWLTLLKYDFFALRKVVRPQYTGEVGNFTTFRYVKFLKDAVHQKLLKFDNFWQSTITIHLSMSYTKNKKDDFLKTQCI